MEFSQIYQQEKP